MAGAKSSGEEDLGIAVPPFLTWPQALYWRSGGRFGGGWGNLGNQPRKVQKWLAERRGCLTPSFVPDTNPINYLGT